ncbi:MAG: hypothetical protein Q9167_003996 [Letrouitia subvulpina]
MHDLNCFYKYRVLTANSAQATQVLPPNSSSAVLDSGCGLGPVTAEVKKSFPNLSVLAIDSSAGMLKVVDHVPSNSITHAFACTYIDLAHIATACIQELHRVIAPGGILGISTWADPIHPSISTPWTKACRRLHPGFKAPFVTSPKWSTAEQIKKHLEKAGFKDVQTKQVMTHWRWKSPEEMTGWFFDGGNPVYKRWHEALVEEVGGELGEMREKFHEELVKEYRNEGGQLLKEELVNLTIARK